MIRLWKRNKFPEIKHPISKAFTCGGVDYFQFDNAFNLPYYRGIKAVTYFEEVRMKCTYEFLRDHQKAIKNLLTGNKIDIFQINALNEQLGQRLSMVYDEDILYKFAAVWYFDSSEDPAGYDFKYAKKKIDHWKKHMEAHEFFFQQPIQKLLPFLRDYEDVFQDYSKVVEKINATHSAAIQSQLSPN